MSRVTRNIPIRTGATLDEYLEFERSAETRHESVDGQILAMAGESSKHADISANLVGEFHSRLKGTDCRVRTKDTKVRSGFMSERGPLRKGMISYLDVVVICGVPEYHDSHYDVVLNPRVIFEVLSEATSEFDRTEKFHRYHICNPTLSDCILISQDRILVEHYLRQTDDTWIYRCFSEPDSVLDIESIGCRLTLADIYYLVEQSISR